MAKKSEKSNQGQDQGDLLDQDEKAQDQEVSQDENPELEAAGNDQEEQEDDAAVLLQQQIDALKKSEEIQRQRAERYRRS